MNCRFISSPSRIEPKYVTLDKFAHKTLKIVCFFPNKYNGERNIIKFDFKRNLLLTLIWNEGIIDSFVVIKYDYFTTSTNLILLKEPWR